MLLEAINCPYIHDTFGSPSAMNLHIQKLLKIHYFVGHDYKQKQLDMKNQESILVSHSLLIM